MYEFLNTENEEQRIDMKMDVFVGYHDEAIRRGRHDAIVYIKRIGGLE